MNPVTVTGQQPLSRIGLQAVDAYWRAASYLSARQIYLTGSPLLTRPLRPEDVKPGLPRPLGHHSGAESALRAPEPGGQGLGPGHDLPRGPGHGGPGVAASAWLEGTCGELYPHVTRDGAGLEALCRQFSFPGRILGRAAPETPGPVREGGCVLAHGYGAVFGHRGLTAACVTGGGGAETAPRSGPARRRSSGRVGAGHQGGEVLRGEE